MKIKLVTAASEDYWDILNLTAPNKMEYCLRHGLELSVRKHEGKNIPLERIKLMLNELDGTDWIFFNGADTLIMNHTKDVRDLLDNEHDVIIGQDINGINNDVMFIRNTFNSLQFLRICEYYIIVKQLDDQEAMKCSMKELPELKVKIVHQKEFNSYLYSEYSYPNDGGGSYTGGDFVLHLPGIPNERRKELLTEYLGKVIK